MSVTNTNDQNLKKQLLNTYLSQQQPNKNIAPSVVSENENINEIVLYNDINPDNIGLEEFKILIKKWFEYDNFIKRAKDLISEKKKSRDKLSEVISKFMCKNELEDINTKEGRIRCKTTTVKAPVNQKVIKEKISDYFKGNENQKNDILHKIYDEREEVEKVSLRRLKIT
jgi:hypothetical protein